MHVLHGGYVVGGNDCRLVVNNGGVVGIKRKAQSSMSPDVSSRLCR